MKPVGLAAAPVSARARVLLAGGCAVLGGPGSPPRTAAPATTVSEPPRAGLFVVESRTLGPTVIDAQGFVLYRFDGDSTRPPRSNCVGECATRWLPVPAAADVRVEGIDRQPVRA